MSAPIRFELPTGYSVGPVNVYLFVKPEPVLVDTGVRSEESIAALRAGLAAHNLTMADLAKVIISHPHTDHCGIAGLIAAESQASFHIYEPAKRWLIDYDEMWQKRTAYHQEDLFVYWQLEDAVRQPLTRGYTRDGDSLVSVPAERVKTFIDGDIIFMGGLPWQVLYTPGHANTLTCFYQADSRQYLSTDMLLPITPTPIPELPLDDEAGRVPALPQFLQSLTRIEALDCEMIYPGHGQPFTDHRAVIKRQRDRIAQRKQECLSLIKAGRQTLGELVIKMYPTFPPEARFAALWMTMGYLDLLVLSDQIDLAEQIKDGKSVVEIRLK